MRGRLLVQTLTGVPPILVGVVESVSCAIRLVWILEWTSGDECLAVVALCLCLRLCALGLLVVSLHGGDLQGVSITGNHQPSAIDLLYLQGTLFRRVLHPRQPSQRIRIRDLGIFPSVALVLLLSFLFPFPIVPSHPMTRHRHSLEYTDPLLPSQDGTPQTPTPTKRRKQLRIPRQVYFILLPILLTLLYASLTQITPLPPLPRIRIVHASDTEADAQNVLTLAQECACGIPAPAAGEQTEGQRLCAIYGKDTLARSRALLGTGARVQRMLDRAQRERRALNVGVLGGSGTSSFPSPSSVSRDR